MGEKIPHLDVIWKLAITRQCKLNRDLAEGNIRQKQDTNQAKGLKPFLLAMAFSKR
jgi:hypothetical protein